MNTKLFVYGSLKRGLPMHGHLEDLEFVGELRTYLPLFIMYNYHAKFPVVCLTTAGNGGYITGELYEGLTPDLMEHLRYVETNAYSPIEVLVGGRKAATKAMMFIGTDPELIRSASFHPEETNVYTWSPS